MGGIEIQIRNDNIDDILKKLGKAKEVALNEVGLQLERNAKIEINKSVYDTPESPNYVRTGRLRASITYATKTAHSQGDAEAEAEDYEMHGQPEDGEVYVGTNVEYAPYVEFGTSKTRAKPFLRPAIENYRNEYLEILKSNLSDI